jgi:hypothetical protein
MWVGAYLLVQSLQSLHSESAQIWSAPLLSGLTHTFAFVTSSSSLFLQFGHPILSQAQSLRASTEKGVS